MDESEMLRKIRLLSLAYLCAENTSVDFSAVATALGVKNADVEMWIIDGEFYSCPSKLVHR